MIHQCDTRKGSSCSGNITDYDGVHLVYAGGHCHAPSCISMELYNADTGKLLCRHSPVYGQSDQVSFFLQFFIIINKLYLFICVA